MYNDQIVQLSLAISIDYMNIIKLGPSMLHWRLLGYNDTYISINYQEFQLHLPTVYWVIQIQIGGKGGL